MYLTFTHEVPYEIQVRSVCNANNSDYSGSVEWVPETNVIVGITTPFSRFHRTVSVSIPGFTTLYFNLAPEKKQNRYFDIITIAGRKIMSIPYTGRNIVLAPQKFAGGLYLIRFNDAGKPVTKKVVFY
jgi:hypothetical protein